MTLAVFMVNDEELKQAGHKILPICLPSNHQSLKPMPFMPDDHHILL